MSRFAYRLIKNQFLNAPLSAEGSRRYGGRWNPAGIGILYTSASPELALLEQLVHLRTLPFDDLPRLTLLTLSLPEEPRTITLAELPKNWRDEADFHKNHQFLTNWLTNPDTLAIGIPSAVVAESYNYLLHPFHPDFKRIELVKVSDFTIDSRLFRNE